MNSPQNLWVAVPLKSLTMFAFIAISCSTILAQTKIDSLGTFGKAEKVFGDFKFTEGPTDDGKGNLYFTDIPANRIYKIDAAGKKTVFVEPSNHCNGLMIDGSGNLLACQMDGQLVSYDVKTAKFQVLANKYSENRFNACNDLVVDKSGGVYFTDPHYRAPRPLPQGTMAFYYRAADGKVTRLGGEKIKAPNGIILSPDEKTLYVIPSEEKKMRSYEVLGPGKIGEEKVFCETVQSREGGNSGGDGLTIDEKGNLYITTGLGLQIFSPQGKHLGTIALPEHPANVTFGGKENKTIYATARTGLYRVQAPVKGHRFPGAVSLKK